MERDFSEQKLIELKGYLYDETADMANECATIASNHFDMCEELEIFEQLNRSPIFDQLLRLRHETMCKNLDQIFTDVRAADVSYGKVIDSYVDGASKIKNYISQLAEIINPKNNNFTVASCTLMRSQLSIQMNELNKNKKARAEEILARHAENKTPITEVEKKFLASYLEVMTEERVTGMDLKDKNILTDADRGLLIQIYEIINPENAGKMDQLFAGMKADTSYDYGEDITYLKYITYTAEEPYRSVFMEYAGEMKMGDYKLPLRDVNNTKLVQHYAPDSEELYLRFTGAEGLNDPRGPYVTFFHECGHAIDDMSAKDEKYDFLFYKNTEEKNTIWEYKNAEGDSLQEVAYNDVRQNVKNYVDQYVDDKNNKVYLTNEQREEVVDKILKCNDSGYIEASPQKKVYDKTIEAYIGIFKNVPTNQTIYNGISDIYGGYTDNKLNNHVDASKHTQPNYWNNQNNQEYTGMQSKELWAHIYARSMLGDDDALKQLNTYVPESVKMVEKISNYIATN